MKEFVEWVKVDDDVVNAGVVDEGAEKKVLVVVFGAPRGDVWVKTSFDPGFAREKPKRCAAAMLKRVKFKRDVFLGRKESS